MTPSLRKHPRPSQWLVFTEDGGVEVLTGKVEIGQALHAALAGWVAGSLSWPVERVRVVAPDTTRSPDEGVTSGSLSMQDSGRTLAGVAAVVRARLEDDAAGRWGVPRATVRLVDAVLTGPDGWCEPVTAHLGRTVLDPAVGADEWTLEQADGTGSRVGAPQGGSPAQVDGAAMASRRARVKAMLGAGGHFIQDLVLPGLLHGCVLHRMAADGAGPSVAAASMGGAEVAQAATRPDEKVLSLVRAMPGVRAVIVDAGLLGVLADGAGRAERAARRWLSEAAAAGAEVAGSGRGAVASGLADPLNPSGWASHPWPARCVARHGSPDERGPDDPDGAQRLEALHAPEGGRVVQAVFTRGWLAHASIGPSCALARWTDDLGTLEVWTHSQGVFNLRRDLALAWGLDEAAVVVRHVPGAGCYGHNGADDVAFDASWLARQAPGYPVRVNWLREQEWRSAPLGPAMRVHVQAALDAQGRIVHWHHAFWSPGHSSRPGRSATPSLRGHALRHGGAPLPEPIDMPLATGGGGERNAVPGYAWPAWQVIGHRVRVPWRASALRSLGAHANVYAAENLLDDIARQTGQCPWALRLAALTHEPRAIAVLNRARTGSRWDARRAALAGIEGAGLGLAYARYKNTGAWCAVVAEVRAEAVLRVLRLTVVADIGLPIHPEGAVQQLEGGAVQATSWTLMESVLADAHGGIAPATWDDYPIIGFDAVPDVDVHLMPSTEPPLGAGEAACGPAAAAIGNALFDALGVRVRDLPLTPERIVAAMAA